MHSEVFHLEKKIVSMIMPTNDNRVDITFPSGKEVAKKVTEERGSGLRKRGERGMNNAGR